MQETIRLTKQALLISYLIKDLDLKKGSSPLSSRPLSIKKNYRQTVTINKEIEECWLHWNLKNMKNSEKPHSLSITLNNKFIIQMKTEKSNQD